MSEVHETTLDSCTVVRFSAPTRQRQQPHIIRMEISQMGVQKLLVETMTHEKALQMWTALGRAIMYLEKK